MNRTKAIVCTYAGMCTCMCVCMYIVYVCTESGGNLFESNPLDFFYTLRMNTLL